MAHRRFYYKPFVKQSFIPRGDSILFYRFLWISIGFIGFILQSKRNIIDCLTYSVCFILFRWVNLLKFWHYSFTSRCQISIIMALLEVINSRKYRRRPGPEILYSRLGVTLSYSYLKWYNPRPYHFCVHLPLIEILRTKYL